MQRSAPYDKFRADIMKKSKAGGIAYIDSGNSDVGLSEDESPVLFLHGLGNSKTYWRATACLLATSYRCLILDIPGFGESDKIGNLSINSATRRIDEFLDELGIGRVSIVAHSMGAFVALALAERRSGVDQVILVDGTLWRAYSLLRGDLSISSEPALAWNLGAQFAGGLLPFKKLTAALLSSSALVRSIFMRPFISRFDLPDELLLRDALAANRGGTALVSAALGPKSFELDRLLDQISCPIYSIRGCNDRLINDTDTAYFAAHAQRFGGDVCLEGIGHWPMIEDPERLTQVLLDRL